MGGMVLRTNYRRIPWTVVARWCRENRRPAGDRDFLWRCFHPMEAEYRKQAQARQAMEGK